jgi:flavin reductase (DIM6/NTAB) family NADH-FMN oxidoreductase RutF
LKKSLGAKTFGMPLPVWLVGTYGEQEQPNIMSIAWGGICCTYPPCIAISLQKNPSPRASHANILRNKAFTINIPSSTQLLEADYAGIVSGKTTDKFAITHLIPVKSDVVNAPYIQEFPMIIECSLVQVVEIGSETQFIGEILDVKADESVLGENGLPVAKKLNPLIYSSTDRLYYDIGSPLGPIFATRNTDGKLTKIR